MNRSVVDIGGEILAVRQQQFTFMPRFARGIDRRGSGRRRQKLAVLPSSTALGGRIKDRFSLHLFNRLASGLASRGGGDHPGAGDAAVDPEDVVLLSDQFAKGGADPGIRRARRSSRVCCSKALSSSGMDSVLEMAVVVVDVQDGEAGAAVRSAAPGKSAAEAKGQDGQCSSHDGFLAGQKGATCRSCFKYEKVYRKWRKAPAVFPGNGPRKPA